MRRLFSKVVFFLGGGGVCICMGTKYRGQVVNTPAPYLGGPGFKSRTGDSLS
jgi:hypothetical protein